MFFAGNCYQKHNLSVFKHRQEYAVWFFSSKHRLKSHLWDFGNGASWCRFFLPPKIQYLSLLVYLTKFLPKSLNDKTILDGDGTIGWQWPTPPPPSHHILILLPKLPNPPPPLSSHFRISYILQISAFFLFSNFRKGRLRYIPPVGWNQITDDDAFTLFYCWRK